MTIDRKNWQVADVTDPSRPVDAPRQQLLNTPDWTELRRKNAIERGLPAPSADLLGEAEPLPSVFARTFVPPDISRPPYDAMCKIFYRNLGQDYVASGWIVEANSGKAILTSGHVVFDKGHWSSDFYVMRQYSAGDYGQVFTAHHASTLNGWINQTGLREYWDLGAIIPDTPVPVSTPSLHAVFDYQPTQPPFNFYYDPGYPAKPANGYDFNGSLLWQSDGELLETRVQGTEVVLKAVNTMEQGSSGSPWLVYDALQNRYYAAGMQSSGVENSQSSFSPRFSSNNLIVLLKHIGILI
ncbi:trypsin-like serine peptidase [Pseudomonas sp. 2835]|uniref:trypsin-like serine peptidase n=1 Tax=Pseudomonas sp. 2835 TaxID=3156451 RepID=UPI003D1FEDAA